MKTTTRSLILLLVGLILPLQTFAQPDPPKESPPILFAGTAKINITPSTPIIMSGYGNRTEPFKGVHDSIYATAVAFYDGQNKALLLTADVIGFSHPFCHESLDRIEQATGIDREFILLTATHNHGGPSNRAYRDEAPPEVEKYTAELQSKLVTIAKEAASNLQAVKLGTGKGVCTMNINRRARLADGSIWLGRNPDGPCDNDVAVTKIETLDGKPLAILVNWPCHGTVSGQDNYEITGDWPGATARFVEKAFEGQVIVPVTAGASGDINPIYGPNNRFRDIDAIGMLVGEEVVRVANEVETFAAGSIQAAKTTFMASGKKSLASRFPNQQLEPNEDVEIRLSVLKVGKLVFAGISGEVMTEIGMKIKSESPYKNTVILTHCNGNSGYLCTDKAYPEGGYEAMVSRTMPGTADLISENLKKMIRSLE